MTEGSNALVPAQPSGISFGQTELRPQDIVVPRVKVVQQMAKEAANKLAEPGDFYNVLTGERYGPTLRIQPILPFMNRVFLVRQEKRDKADELLKDAGLPELGEGDGLKCRSLDMIQGNGEPGVECDHCPLSQWTHDKKKGNLAPLCTETYNVAACNELGELLVVSFSRSSAKIGKRIFSAIRLRPVAPWTQFFDLETHQERNDLGTFYVPEFRIAQDKPDTALIQQAMFWAKQLEGVSAEQIDVTPDDEGPTRSTDVGDVDIDAGDKPF